MADYISREAAIAYIKDNQCKRCSDIGLCGKCAVLTAVKLFESIPAADVREVVRCKDCALWNARGIIDRRPAKPTKRMCANWQRRTESEDYCSIGEAWRVSDPNFGADMREES